MLLNFVILSITKIIIDLDISLPSNNTNNSSKKKKKKKKVGLGVRKNLDYIG